ncbi:MAG: NAD(P)-binding domain-containing protein, partial [bacterium]|nr:NAD(P)-binding domain-containing protein [bacterium]
GLKQSGVTIFYVAEQADEGDILKQISYPIDEEETATTLYKKVCAATYQLISETYPQLAANREERLKQDDSLATVWTKRKPSDGLLCWKEAAEDLCTMVRAVTHPYPGAFTFLGGKKMFVWKAKPISCLKTAVAGSVVAVQDDGVVVAAGDGALLLESVQWEGDVEKAASEILKTGDVFEPLHRVKEIAEKVVNEAKAKGKISIFSVANTANPNNPSVVFPAVRETDTTIAGNVIVTSQEQIRQILEMTDGLVDIILMDAETKVPGWVGAPLLFQERVKKSRLLTYKPNDVTAEALDALLAQRFSLLAGKKVAIIGAGNLGSKMALKLVERGCDVVLTRRHAGNLRKIAEGLNTIKSIHTKSEVRFTTDNLEACHGADVVIGATSGMGV